MEYDFDMVTDRRNSDSLKWGVGKDELPMWVADMDFPAAPCIREALTRRIDHGVFGYTEVSDAWYDAYISWWRDRHGLTVKREELIFCTGVVPAISAMVRKLTTPAEKVLLQTPVYNIFFNSVLNQGRQVTESALKYTDGEYSVDWADLESKLADPQTSLMILCNPHNPVGKIWSRETLARIGRLCRRYHVTVISDEIHCDLTDPGKSYVPFASADGDCRAVSVTCVAPTKAFNIAGLQTSAVIVPDPFLRHKVWRGLNTDEVAEPNVFAADAAVAAFTRGGEWLDQLRSYIYANKQTVCGFLSRHLPQLHLVPSDATYLLWIDCSRLTEDADALAEHIRKTTGLYVSGGSQYGSTGRAFLRLNIACPASTLADGLQRLCRGVQSYQAHKV